MLNTKGRKQQMIKLLNFEKYMDFEINEAEWTPDGGIDVNDLEKYINDLPELVICKDCANRPVKKNPYGADFGFNIQPPESADRYCPCVNEDDGWYSWMPDDNYYCAYGRRKVKE